MITKTADQVDLWLHKKIPLAELAKSLYSLEAQYGSEISQAINDLCLAKELRPLKDTKPWDHFVWQEALMGCRARTWIIPNSAGLLLGQDLLIITNGQQGVILREEGVLCLSANTCMSLLLLAQTIVMADNALDEHEVDALRRQRAGATSTSLSELEPI